MIPGMCYVSKFDKKCCWSSQCWLKGEIDSYIVHYTLNCQVKTSIRSNRGLTEQIYYWYVSKNYICTQSPIFYCDQSTTVTLTIDIMSTLHFGKQTYYINLNLAVELATMLCSISLDNAYFTRRSCPWVHL
jgi:hypothetical protein